MSFVDYVERGKTLNYKGSFNLDNLYKFLTKWCKKNGYDITEEAYDVLKKQDTQNIHIEWKADKRVSDYTKDYIEIWLTCTNVKTQRVKNKKTEHGAIKFEFNSYQKKDYEDIWARKPFTRFLRETYDKFIIGSRTKKAQDNLKSDLKNLNSKLKVFLNTKK